MKNSPFFIIGCGRSGTTLLRLMLTSHPQISIPPESRFIILLSTKWGHVTITKEAQVAALISDLYQEKKFVEWGLTPVKLQERLQKHLPLGFPRFVELIHQMYWELYHPQATYWGDKNPMYAFQIANLKNMFPDARFIHLIRDGRAVFNSFISANQRAGRKIWPEHPARAAKEWTKHLRATMPYRQDENYFEIHYENLIQAPEKTLRNICDFLQLVYHEAMLNYHAINKNILVNEIMYRVFKTTHRVKS